MIDIEKVFETLELDRDCDSTFVIMHAGWECDDKVWIMPDGRVLTTSHGSHPYPMSLGEIEEKISETERCLAGLKDALTVTKRKEVKP